LPHQWLLTAMDGGMALSVQIIFAASVNCSAWAFVNLMGTISSWVSDLHDLRHHSRFWAHLALTLIAFGH